MYAISSLDTRARPRDKTGGKGQQIDWAAECWWRLLSSLTIVMVRMVRYIRVRKVVVRWWCGGWQSQASEVMVLQKSLNTHPPQTKITPPN